MPQVTVGAMSAAASVTSRSKTAPGSVGRAFQDASACAQASPRGANGLPSMNAKVVSSGPIMPARAPASIDMLQTVMRSSMDMARIAEPAYSMACRTPPPAPIVAMIARITSLAETPVVRRPSTEMRMVRGFFCQRVWVARTCSTSLEPIPNASAPNAPWVAVCESPQTSVMPGTVSPCSGPMTCTIPRRRSPTPKWTIRWSAV